MMESYLLVAMLTMANGEKLEVVGEEYPTYEICMKANRKEMEEIRSDIRKKPTVFKDMSFTCEKLTVLYPEGVKFDD